jgi:protein-S-isoprenylcysteine O-methyltransferase Ste14
MTVESKLRPEAEIKELNRALVQGIIRFIVISIVLGVILFGSAGTITWTRGWIYLGITLLILFISRLILFVINPAAAVERSRRVKPDQLFDKVFYALSTPLLFAFLIIAGLDAERFGWSYLPMGWTWAGSCGYILFATFSIWPMLINPHFEAVVRIQKDRGHKVIDIGPYRIVRHPGYAAGIIVYLFNPLILGSLYAFIPAGLVIILYVYRTANEDKMLRRELEEYEEYTKRTRYRLIPGIW